MSNSIKICFKKNVFWYLHICHTSYTPCRTIILQFFSLLYQYIILQLVKRKFYANNPIRIDVLAFFLSPFTTYIHIYTRVCIIFYELLLYIRFFSPQIHNSMVKYNYLELPGYLLPPAGRCMDVYASSATQKLTWLDDFLFLLASIAN